MTISFNTIPSDLRVPLFYAEVDNSQANSGGSSMPRLIVAQVNDDATAAEIGQLTLVSSLGLAKSIGGVGSMLAQALPLALVAFLLFPRAGSPLWGMSTDASRATSAASVCG